VPDGIPATPEVRTIDRASAPRAQQVIARRENAKPLVYLAYSIGPEALAVGVDELYAKNDKNALEEATPLFHDRLKRIEIWCGSRKVGDIPPRQDDVSDSGAISGCA
jgi:hypothetical protein